MIAGVFFLVLLVLSCGDEGAPTAGGTCLDAGNITIINASEYDIIRLYAHNTVDFFNEAPSTPLKEPMPTEDSVTMPVIYGDSYYFTFVRDIFTGATIEIAVTTAKPVTIEECYTYTLYLLEEEFSVETTSNYAK